MARIFISYSHYDKDYAAQIVELLKRMNLSVFLDEKDIQWGEKITSTIENVLSQNITHEIVIVSPGSLKSQWVSYEVGFAKAKGIHILPFFTHPALDVPLFLSNYHYATNLKEIEEYFRRDIKLLRVVMNDGEEEDVELITAFEFNDNKHEYVLYTKNEVDSYGKIMIYINKVKERIEGMPILGKVDDSDWGRIKEVLIELGDESLGEDASRRVGGVTYYDSERTQII